MKGLWMALFCLAAAGTASAEVRVISGGAVEPGVAAFAALVRQDPGCELKILYNTAPQIAQRLAMSEVYDILIAPSALIESALREGRAVPETRVQVGRVGIGVVVRSGVVVPEVATVEALRKALLEADSVVYNRASTGIYLDRLFAQMGIAEVLEAKTTRYPTGGAVMEHVLRGQGRELGFGAITEIRRYESKGIRPAGPLPEAIQNYTLYEAALMAGAKEAAAARAVLRRLATPAARAVFRAAGVQ